MRVFGTSFDILQRKALGEEAGMERKSCDEILQQTLDMAEAMLLLADEGDRFRREVGCGILYGKDMYPEMIQAAQEEGHKAAERSFRFGNEVEKVHAGLYQKVLDHLDALEDVEYYVCPVCGYTAENESPDTCPVCGAKGSVFFEVD